MTPEQQANPVLMAELLLSVTGLWPSVSHPSPNDELAAMGLLDAYRARLKRWLRAPDAEDYKPRKFEAPEPPKEKTLQDKILDPMDAEEEARLRAGLPELEQANAYVSLVVQGRAYLDAQWPKIPVPGMVAEVFPLSQEELYDVWALARVLDNPDALFDELEAQSITIPMVNAWREIYPTVASEVDTIIDSLLIERQADKKRLTWQQADLVRMLRGVPLDTVIQINKPAPKGSGTGNNAKMESAT